LRVPACQETCPPGCRMIKRIEWAGISRGMQTTGGPVSRRAGYVRMFRLRVPACQETCPPGCRMIKRIEWAGISRGMQTTGGPVSRRAGYVRMFRLRVPACQETGPPGDKRSNGSIRYECFIHPPPPQTDYSIHLQTPQRSHKIVKIRTKFDRLGITGA
jgi:hypothetical protein